jgi:hypothetical protein
LDDGTKTYTFTYDFTGSWWAGFGLNLANGRSSPPVDLSGYSLMQITYKGLEDALKLSLTLVASDDASSQAVEIGGKTDVYTTVEIPLKKFDKEKFDPTKVTSLLFSLAGAASGKGVVRMKSIRFVSLD